MNPYPTEADLRKIRTLDKLGHSLQEMVNHIRSIWWMPEWGFKLRGHRLELHTGGWSGNEDVISRLERTMFWTFTWTKSFRGGHYYFELPKWWTTVLNPQPANKTLKIPGSR